MSLRADLSEIDERAGQLRKLFPLCVDASVTELITQAANELRRLRGMTVRAPKHDPCIAVELDETESRKG